MGYGDLEDLDEIKNITVCVKKRFCTDFGGFGHLENFCPGYSSSSFTSFAIRVSLLHPKPSLLLYCLLLSFWCFSILVNYYFQVSFDFVHV